MDETVNFIDDAVDNFIGSDTDIVKNIYGAMKKPLLDYTKLKLANREVKIKKLPKDTTVGNFIDRAINSEENLEFHEKIEKLKKNKKALKMYEYDDFFRKANKKILLVREMTDKFPTKPILSKLVENAGNGFFIYKAQPKGRPDLSMMFKLDDLFMVMKSDKEFHIKLGLVEYVDENTFKITKTIDYDYKKNIVSEI